MSSAVRGLAADAAIAHHEDPERAVRDLRPDIDRARHAVERVEIFGKALPFPVQAFGERGTGNVLDRLHQIDKAGAVLPADRREADSAIAEQDRRHAVPGGRGEHRVPSRLAVVMRMLGENVMRRVGACAGLAVSSNGGFDASCARGAAPPAANTGLTAGNISYKEQLSVAPGSAPPAR